MDLLKIKNRLKFLENFEEVHSVLVFGSYARGNATSRSDVDVCLVMPNCNDCRRREIAELAAGKLGKRFDVKVFEFMPLFLKISVINNHIIIFTRDKCELYEYFYFYRKIWKDQKHRNTLKVEDFRTILNALGSRTESLERKFKTLRNANSSKETSY